MMNSAVLRRLAVASVVLCCVWALPSCNPDAFINNTASLGGDIPSQRGAIQVVINNQTDYRAIFTLGTYDPQDQSSAPINTLPAPIYVQYAVDPDLGQTDFNQGVQAHSVTLRSDFTVPCGRAVSIGGAEMIARINANKVQPANGLAVMDQALRPGIYFSDKDLTDPDANGTENPVVVLPEINTLQGVQYQSGSLLTYYFMPDPDDPTQVVVSLDVYVPEHTP